LTQATSTPEVAVCPVLSDMPWPGRPNIESGGGVPGKLE
jgi:hypothetical protein